MEKYDFIKMMLSNRKMSINDKKRLVLLATRELEQIGVSKGSTTPQKKSDPTAEPKAKKHVPKDTASFLSLFNRRDGLKYLTHNYDCDNMSLEDMIKQAKRVLGESKKGKTLPSSLVALISNFLNGREWLDYDGNKCTDGYGNPKWTKWSLDNGGRHPITDLNGMENVIQRFRHTIRVVAPDLLEIIEQITKKFPSIQVCQTNLDKADFYTNVLVFKARLTELFRDLQEHVNQGTQKIFIEYVPNIEGDFFIHQLHITQVDSFSTKSIEQVIKKFQSTGGFFYENAHKMFGYCNWSVESLWDGKPFRWNILDDSGANIIEEIDAEKVRGFSHILTFYQKD